VARSIELRPDVVRIYPAVVIRDTALEQLYHDGHYVPLTLNEAIAWCREAMAAFRTQGIPVIRVGLQSTDTLEFAGSVIAGPYHSAFRQLVESALFLEAMQQTLNRTARRNTAAFRVNPADLSTALGQKRCNIKTLKEQYGIETIQVIPDPLVLRGAVAPG
jgi:histone acetyltransferase (RNA polymerase elongator complex component)